MKIALIIERFNIALGGAERSVYEIAERLKQTGQQVTILASVAPADAPGVVALCGHDPHKRISFGVYRNALIAHLKTNSYDLVHSTLPLTGADVYQPLGGSYIETYIRNAASYPNLLTAAFKRATYFTNLKRMQYLRAEQDLCRNGHAVIAALSSYVRGQYKRHFNLPDDRIFMTPNGVDTELAIDTAAAAKNEQDIVRTLKLDRANTTLLLFGANNFRLKGLYDLLAAMAGFKRQTPDRRIALIVAGSGKQSPYRRLAARWNIADDVYFTGYINSIQDYLSVCDAAALPSYYDPCSRFILEGIAIAKPVLTTRYNGASEYYTHLRHGVILDEPNHLHAFVEGLNALSQPQQRQAMSDAIRQDNLKQTVSIEMHCDALMNLYETLYQRKQK